MRNGEFGNGTLTVEIYMEMIGIGQAVDIVIVYADNANGTGICSILSCILHLGWAERFIRWKGILLKIHGNSKSGESEPNSC